MIGGRISRFFKSIFSHKYVSKVEKHTNHTTCKWDGTSMSKYSGRERLTHRENKWLGIYGATGSDIRKRGYWKIAQKQLKHLFSVEQINEHTEFNKSLSGIKSDESKSHLDRTWKTMLATHCKLNRILYQSVDTYLPQPATATTKKPILSEPIPELLEMESEDSGADEDLVAIQAMMDNDEIDTGVNVDELIREQLGMGDTEVLESMYKK